MSLRTLSLSLVLVACSSASTPTAVVAPTPPPPSPPAVVTPDAAIAPDDVPVVSADAAPTTESSATSDAAVTSADASDGSNEIVVTGGSDLPTAEGNTNAPFAATMERTLAPLATALTECLRPIIPRQRRLYRVLVRADGRITERAPQTFAMSLRSHDCMQRTLTPVRVSPPPPREIPYDIAVEPAPDRPMPVRRP